MYFKILQKILSDIAKEKPSDSVVLCTYVLMYFSVNKCCVFQKYNWKGTSVKSSY